MKLRKSDLDEMQEQKLLRIEHNGCWLAFWGLLAAMAIQLAIYGPDAPGYYAGEWVVFMALALYQGIATARNGIWDRRLRPNAKTNLLLSLIAAVAVAALMFTVTYTRYGSLAGSIATGAITGGWSFGLCFGALSLAARYVRKRRQALEAEPEDEGD